MSYNLKRISALSILSIFLVSCNIGNTIDLSSTLQTSQSIEKDYTSPENIDSNTILSFSTLDLKAYDKKDSISTSFNNHDKKENEKKDNDKKEIKSWFKNQLKKHQKARIDSITIVGTNKRVDEQGTDSIKPDFSGSVTSISIKGKFDEDIVKKNNIMFSNEPNLLQLSYVDDKTPKSKLLLDEAIFLEVTSANKNEIIAKISTQAVLEYYLKGLHKISILYNDDVKTDALIRIGDPEPPKVSLSPVIDEIKIIKARDVYIDKDTKQLAFKVSHIDDIKEYLNYKLDTPINLKIKGKNFMTYYKFAYNKIDGKFGFVHSTAISKDASGNIIYESIVHIADIKDFQSKSKHTISYSTPFGTAIKSF